MPTPNEVKALRTALELGVVTKRKLGSRMGINTEYAGHLLETLCKRDYLLFVPPGKFELAPNGENALLYHLHHIKGMMTARAYGNLRQLENINDRISDYEEYMKKKLIVEIGDTEELVREKAG